MQSVDRDNYQLFYEYWEELEPIKYVSIAQFEIIEHPIREAIVRVLRKGIAEDGQGKNRRVLSMPEILREVNELLASKNDDHKEIKKSGLYYHVDLLVDSDLISEVTTMKVDRHHQSFYGRTAKGFILRDSDKADHPKKLRYMSLYTKLITALNEDMKEEDVEQLFQEMEATTKEVSENLDLWMRENIELFNALDVDIIDLFTVIDWIFYTHPQTIKGFQKIAHLLQLPGFESS